MKMCDVTLFDGGVKDAQGRLGDFAHAMRPNPGPKAKLPGWSPTVFKDNRRSKDRVQWTSAIVVDVDGGPWAALEAGLDTIDLGCVYHTTPSFTGAEARARVIYPLHTHITGEVALPLARWICATFTQAGCKVDTAASCDLARFWFSPMVGPNFIHTWRPGDWLQPDDPRGIRSDIPERVEALDASRTPPPTMPLARPERGSMMLSLAKLRGSTQDGPTKSLVVCPWDSAHTSGFKLDGSTAVFPSTTASGIGGFRCLHNSCRQRTWKHVVEWHSEADLKNVGWDLRK